jgi:large repetitive protein
VFDLQPAILPDMVFDPFGTAGDVVAKGFTPNSGGTATGYVGFEYLDPHGGDPDDGYDGLGIDFADFDPAETFTFSIDVDPTSIKGVEAPGPNDSGSVSGLELVGSTVTITFSNGAVRTGHLFSDASNAGAFAVVADALPGAPQLAMPGVAGTTTSTANQTLQVTGPAGATVKILQVDSGLYVASGVSFSDPLYSNSIVSQTVATVTLNGSGTASVPVTLRNLNGTAGINHFIAVIDNTGTFGATSQPLTVKYIT